MGAGGSGGQRVVAGRYAIVAELGRGGIGVVWRAQDQVIGRPVALKELRVPAGLSRAEHEAFVARVLREARTAGGLNDPAIVTVHDVVLDGGAMYIVMELIEADNLGELIARTGPLSEQRATELALQVLSALDTAHAAGIVHRDIKPSNIMILPGDRAKLADFGIAQAMDDPSLTATGGIMGSPGYMAPELFHGDPPSPATDLWSLGATLFHVVEGHAPFQRGSTAATMHAIMYDDPRLNRCRGPLAAVIMGLLVHEPDQRLRSAQVRDRLAGTPTAVPADVERTDVLPRVEAEATALVDRDRTTAVTRRPRTTQPWSPVDDEFTELVPDAGPIGAPGESWEPKRRNRKRVLLAGLAVVVVLALAGVAIALTNGQGGSVAAPPSRGARPSIPGLVLTELPTSTTNAATSTTTLAPTTTNAATTTRTTSTHQAGGLPPAPPAPPATQQQQLTYVGIARYHNTTTGYHLTTTVGAALPSGFSEEGALGYLVTTNAPGTIRFYLCEVASSGDYFSSVDQSGGCEGQTTVRMLGYIYANAPASGPSAALYRCNSGASHYDSLNAGCEGNGKQEGRDGYVI